MTVEQLKLAPVMKQRALELLAYCPRVVYISGRRDAEAQAHAMACNIVTDRSYIFKTYRSGAADLQTAIDMNPQAKTVEEIEDVLHDVLIRMTAAEQDRVSDHFAGNAVDIRALEALGELSEEGRAVVEWIQKCPDTKWFTRREGGKIRWHWSCVPSAEV